MNETINIQRLHDNDKYIITRVIKEEINGETLVKICKDIKAGIIAKQAELEQIPKDAEKKTENISLDLKRLNDRYSEFEKFAKNLPGFDTEDKSPDGK